ncbi:MAG: YdcF family protein [Gemmatimonadaceae bacterium]
MERRRPAWQRLVAWTAVALVSIWAISAAAVLAWGWRDDARPSAAIVVLGAAQYVGRPSPVLRARLDHAIDLYQRQLAPTLVLTGGMGEGDTTSEAAVGRRYAMRRGIPDDAIVLENHGRTTSESMRAVATLMHAQSSHGVILVSDPFHMLRLSILARRYGLDPSTSPTRTSPISRNPGERWKYVLSESVKVPLAFLFERSQA